MKTFCRMQLIKQKQMREKKGHFPHACFKIVMLTFEPGTSYKMTVLSLLDAANILLLSVQKAKKDCTQNFDLRPYNLLNLSRYRCFLYESQIYPFLANTANCQYLKHSRERRTGLPKTGLHYNQDSITAHQQPNE